MKKCPYCAEEIQEDAKKCKHCGEWLNKGIEGKNKYDTNQFKPPPLPSESKVETSVSTTSNKVKGKPWYKKWWGILIIVIIIVYILSRTLSFVDADKIDNNNNIISSTKNTKESSISHVDQTELVIIEEEIKQIPKDEYGQEPSSPCRDEKSPGGEGYYMVGGGLIGQRDLAIAVYNARNYCQFRFKSSNTSYCLVGVDMAIRNMSNLKKCYKSKFNKEVPTTTAINKKSSSSPSDAEVDALAERIYKILQ